jgi:hypothetical protein
MTGSVFLGVAIIFTPPLFILGLVIMLWKQDRKNAAIMKRYEEDMK